MIRKGDPESELPTIRLKAEGGQSAVYSSQAGIEEDMDVLKIKKTITSDLLELSGLSQFKGKEVEITISTVTQSATHASSEKPNFMNFAGIAADLAALGEDYKHPK